MKIGDCNNCDLYYVCSEEDPICERERKEMIEEETLNKIAYWLEELVTIQKKKLELLEEDIKKDYEWREKYEASLYNQEEERQQNIHPYSNENKEN